MVRTAGFSHGLKSVHRTLFAPACGLVPTFRIPHSKRKKELSLGDSSFFGPDCGIRTHGLLNPKNSGNFFITISAPFWHLLFQKSCSLKLSSPLSPCTPNPVMVKYVVKPRFCDRTGALQFRTSWNNSSWENNPYPVAKDIDQFPLACTSPNYSMYGMREQSA